MMYSGPSAGHPELWRGVGTLPENKGPEENYLMWEEAEGFLEYLCDVHEGHKNEAVLTALTDAYNRCIEERRRAMDLLKLRERWARRRIGGVEEPDEQGDHERKERP